MISSKIRRFSIVLLLFLVAVGTKSFGQSISLTNPSANTVNVNNLTIQYVVSEPPASTRILLTCNSGPCSTGSSTITLNMVSQSSSPGSFSVGPDLSINSSVFTSTSSRLLDGEYSISAEFTQTGTNALFQSSTVSGIKFDATTIKPTLTSPSSNGSYSAIIPINLTLAEAPLTNSTKLIFTNIAGTYSNTLYVASGTLTRTFNLNSFAVLSNSNIISSTFPTIPSDTYNIVLSYQDVFGHTAETTASTNVLIQTFTPAPTLTNPSSGYVISSSTLPVFTYNIPSAPYSGSVILSLYPGYIYTLPSQSGSGTYTITSNVPVDGTYTATVRYQDFLGNPAASTSGASITFDRATLAPSFISPASNTVLTGTTTLTLSIPEAAAAGSKTLTFTQNGTFVTMVNISDAVTSTLSLNLKNLVITPSVITAISGTTNIPDGTYSVTFSYQDVYLNPASRVAINLTIDSQTLAPSLNRPSSGSSYSTQIPVSLTLGEAYQSGSAKLIFTNTAGNYSNTITLANNSLSQTFTLTSSALVSSGNVVASTYPTLPDGSYNVKLTYKDVYGNPEAYVTNSTILIQTSTPAPTLTSPSSGYVISSSTLPVFTYNIPSTPSSGSVILSLSPGYSYTLPSQSGSGTYTITSNVPVDGTYTATVRYQDFLGNPIASSTGASITFDRATLAPTLTNPVFAGSYSTQIPVSLTLGEAYQAGSAKLVFVNGSNQRFTLTLKDNALSQTFTLSTRNVINANVLSATQTTLPDDVYNVILQYQDIYGNPVNSVSIANVLIQGATPTPVLVSPSNGTTFSRSSNLVFTYNLPSAPLSGTAVLTLAPGYTYPLANTQLGTYTITTNIPADGTYTATVSYQDFLGNPIASSTPIAILVKRNTPNPTIISPSTNRYLSSSMLFKGSIPVANMPGTKKLTILKNSTIQSTITLNNGLTDSLYINLHRLSQASSSVQSIAGVDSLADGIYTLSLSYQDSYGNPSASSSVTINKDASPLIGVLSHTDNVVFGTFTETLTFNKPVVEISANPIIPNLIGNSPSATLGSLTANSTNTVYTFQVTPLKQGVIKLQVPYVGVATDLAGNKSQIIAIDSIQYVDTTVILKPVIVGNLTFCQGDSTTLTSSVANSYLWSTGATSRSIVVKQSGNYQVRTSYDNRVKGISDNVTVTVKPKPSVPIITRDLSNDLVSSNSFGNSWFKDGVAIADTAKKIKAVSGSTYTVRTTQNGCTSSLSSPFVYLITEINHLGSVEFVKLAPNPFVDQIKIDFSVADYQQLNVEVYALSTGLLVASKQGVTAGETIYFGQLQSGTYSLRVVSSDGKVYQQFKLLKL